MHLRISAQETQKETSTQRLPIQASPTSYSPPINTGTTLSVLFALLTLSTRAHFLPCYLNYSFIWERRLRPPIR
jgi:hypothetical protein